MKSNIEKSILILKSIIEDEPHFALAYLDINMTYATLGSIGLISAGAAFIKGKIYLNKGIELDENLPKSQINLALISCYQNWDIEGTYRHLNKV